MVTSTKALGCFARSSWKKGRFVPENVRRKSALIIQNLQETVAALSDEPAESGCIPACLLATHPIPPPTVPEARATRSVHASFFAFSPQESRHAPRASATDTQAPHACDNFSDVVLVCRLSAAKNVIAARRSTDRVTHCGRPGVLRRLSVGTSAASVASELLGVPRSPLLSGLIRGPMSTNFGPCPPSQTTMR
jgi:hypothetical protein